MPPGCENQLFPEMPFNQQVSFPCELIVAKHSEWFLRVYREPIREIALLHKGQDFWTNRTLKVNEVLPLEPSGRLFHIQAEVSIPVGAKLIINIRGVPLILTSKTIESGTSPAPVIDQIKTIEDFGGPEFD